MVKKTITVQLGTWQSLTKRKADTNVDSIDTVIHDLLKGTQGD